MPEATIELLVDEPIGSINPNIYGHFMEHLGACIDEGCWVGDRSSIAHTGGIRNDVVEALRAIDAPVIRWPGGCFADDYHWQDGVGPRHKRPRGINIHWGNVVEKNEFGTHEFMTFCKAVGTEPYFCGNLGSGSPREMRDWVEYCNYPSGSTLAQQRAENGAEEPFNVRFWGVGNENWGCGGNFTPEDYGTEYRRYATYMRNWGDDPLYLIACGPNTNDLDWTRRFFNKLRKDFGRGPALHGFAAHYYCGTAGTATEYTEAQWYELLWKAIQMEPLVVQQRELMDEYDPERKVGLIVDEWGTWHPATPGRNPAFLWQQNTVRDALVAALTLDIFNRHADKVVMSNIAQTINVLQALILTEGDRMLLTPTYHVYDLYRAHMGAQAIRAEFHGADLNCDVAGVARKLPMISGSASIKDGQLALTVVNTSATEAAETSIRFKGALRPDSYIAAHLSYREGDIWAHNTHDDADLVTVAPQSRGACSPDGAQIVLGPASVTRILFQLV